VGENWWGSGAVGELAGVEQLHSAWDLKDLRMLDAGDRAHCGVARGRVSEILGVFGCFR